MRQLLSAAISAMLFLSFCPDLISQTDNDPIPYELMEEKPQFMEGDTYYFTTWVKSEIHYPIEAKNQGISGLVAIQFIIEKNGEISGVKTLRSDHPSLEKEVLRIIGESPNWAPGKHEGKIQRCCYTMSIRFDHSTVDNRGNHNGYDWVDLGLSVRWATCNLGAEYPYSHGNFYSWGALSTTSSYDPSKSLTYNNAIDNITESSKFDAAHIIMKGTWRIPTKEECEELIKKCTWTWVQNNGISGFVIKSKVNGNCIFLPASGVYEEPTVNINNEANTLGCYWTSTPADKKFAEEHLKEAYALRFTSNGPYTLFYSKYFGYNIRPVCD